MNAPLRHILRRFCRDRKGSIAALLAVSLVPIILSAGAAIDYSRAASLKTKLQVATDAAALAVGAKVGEKTDAEIREIAQREFLAVMNTTEGSPRLDETQPIIVSEGRSRLTVRSAINYSPMMMRFPSQGDIIIRASSQTVVANENYEIALVFDNSWSMSYSAGGTSKIAAARKAANKLVDIMYSTDASAKRTKMSIVPFTISVNAGKTDAGNDYSGTGWVDQAGQSPIHWGVNFDRTGSSWQPGSRFDLFNELDVKWAGCFETRPGNYGLTDAPASASDPSSYFVPMFAPDEPGEMANKSLKYYLNTGTDKGKGTNYTYDNTYLNDLGGACTTTPDPNNPAARQAQICKYRINKDKTKRIDGNAGRGPNFACDVQPLLRLTNDKATLKTKIGKMAAVGNTNLLEGFMWGWRTVSPNNPYADGAPYGDAKTRKIIILLTDGQNYWASKGNHNKSLWAPMAYYINERLGTGITSESQATAAMDAKTLQACNNAKQVGVQIYTVGFTAQAGDINESLLEQCATSKATAYLASDSGQLEKVFEEIANGIGGLRLSQ